MGVHEVGYTVSRDDVGKKMALLCGTAGDQHVGPYPIETDGRVCACNANPVLSTAICKDDHFQHVIR